MQISNIHESIIVMKSIDALFQEGFWSFSGGSLQFFWDSIARAIIACQASVLIARAKMTQVTLRMKTTSALERR